MGRLRSLFVSIGVLSLLFSCELDRVESFELPFLATVQAQVPDSLILENTYSIDVTVLIPNSCTSFVGFNITEPELTTRNIVPVGSTQSDDSNCVTTNDELVTTLDLTVRYSNDYLLRFYVGDDNDGNPVFQEYNVPVSTEN